MEVKTAMPPLATELDRVDSAVREPNHREVSSMSPVAGSGANGAATKVQKVYRSYRTKRKLADSAVVVEELWCQALDFARLNHSTVSFYDDPEPETTASRWNRVSLNASKMNRKLHIRTPSTFDQSDVAIHYEQPSLYTSCSPRGASPRL